MELRENPIVRRAKILKLRTMKLKEAYAATNIELTKKLLIDVELELSELEAMGLEEVPVADLSFVTDIMTDGKVSVENVNKAISFGTGMSSHSGKQNSDETGEPSFEYEDVKLRFKNFYFDGEIKNWREFWDRLNVQILSRRRLSKITKFSFLIGCLRGKALELVKGLAITEANFDAAIEKLRKRYDNPERLITAYYDELKEIEASDDTSAAAQRGNYDVIQKILKNLESVGISVDQDYLRTIVMCKFSKDTLRGALKEVRKTDGMYTVTDLMTAIDSVLKIEEDIELALKNRPAQKKKLETTGTFVGGASGSHGSANKRRKSSAVSGGGPIRGARKQKECIFCDSSTHNSPECMRFGNLAKRREVLARKGLCYVCTEKHRQSECPNLDVKCSACQKPRHCLATCITHMISISSKLRKEREQRESGEKSSSSTCAQPTSGIAGTFLQTFVCNIQNPKVAHKTLTVRGLLDPGSKKSYINEYLCRKLKIKSSDSNSLLCYHFGSSEAYEIDTHDFRINLLNSENKSRTCTFTSTPCVTGVFRTSPSSSFAEKILPKHLNFADPDIFASDQRPLEILIGGDLYNQFVDLTETKKLNNGLTILHSFFGNIPFGNVDGTSGTTSVFITGSAPAPVINKLNYSNDNSDFADLTDLERLWSLEMIGIKHSELDNEHDKAVEQYRNTVKYKNKRVICCWPWKHLKPNLSSNYRVARARLRSLVSSLSAENIKKYDDIFQDYLAQGILEMAPKETPYLRHYLCHRCIIQKNRIRIVFDGSAVTSSGHCINDLIYKGPPLQRNIIKLLLNFRINPVAITADIEKAFLQVGLNEVDRDVCTLLWLKDLNKPAEPGNIVHYRFARVPFGVNASPFLLNIVINEHLASGTPNQWHLLARECFYVDNLVVSVPDTNSAVELFHSLRNKFGEISMNLRDWGSNDNVFINSLPKQLIDKLDGLISILGMNWDRSKDTFFVKLKSECPSEPTKRNALKFLASIFDPLGLFGPSTLRLKIFLQKCWKKEYDWSERLPSLLEAELGKLRTELLDVTSIPIPRRIWTLDNSKGTISLHIFCDASMMAFACSAYLVYYNADNCQSASTLIFAKVRTAPISPISIPKLELLGVLIGKRVAVFLRESLDLTIHETIIWTDATTVLQWLNTSNVLPLFIHNRISEIKRTPGISIRHTSGKQNPADLATRGESPKELSNNVL